MSFYYFCCKCHELITIETPTAANRFVCENCKKGEPAKYEENADGAEQTDEHQDNFLICGIGDWK